ncbi:Taurine catabolism dioxygenase TauD/TfdA [Macrophomina phaseolina MS6]|uniref:Taurine catabolism dioxygenase TauD/TfdA n=1 Tax=Macrophomina phaseolina (strain MS6) TaxID=1126212 RepID=K2R886_MACPH|nr:Taurine catabolism dioxygenase TauD/TfdA [Macrophomina phaseolina MS6]
MRLFGTSSSGKPHYSAKAYCFLNDTFSIPSEDLGAPVIAVNYSSITALRDVLEKHQVHTVISTLAVVDADSALAQKNLIQAAVEAAVTQRFVVSDWGPAYTAAQTNDSPRVKWRLESFDILASTDLERRRFSLGVFMDYWGMNAFKSHLEPFAWAVDLENKVAAIPGSGNEPVVFTHSYDVARFVVAALDLPKWERHSFVVGDKLTWDDFLTIAEEVRGCKFEVVHDTVEQLRNRQPTFLPAIKFLESHEETSAMLSAIGIWSSQGVFNLGYGRSLNVLFPEIKPLKVKELLEKEWGGRNT